MKEEIIKLETAKLAKEKGFHIECEYFYENEEILKVFISDDFNNNQYINAASASTQSILQKWLRVEHDIEVWVAREHSGSDDSEYAYYIRHCKYPNKKRECNQYETICSFNIHPGGYSNIILSDYWEAVLEKGLQEALKLIK